MARTDHPAVGIDLGTTFSVLACLDAQGRPQTIPNAEGDLTTPSAVLFEEMSITVGKEALKAASLEPDRIALFAKRDMGSPHYSRPIAGAEIPPEVIQSLVLEKLRKDAEPSLGPVERAVITVPAYFNEPRRKATQDAGRLASLEVLDIINEPTAAAIAYGYQQGFLTPEGATRQPERILVYDLGGGTFDVTLMSIDNRQYTTLATAGDVHLGGIDWDRRLVDHVAEAFRARHGCDPREDAAGLQRLLRDAEDAKRALTARPQTTMAFEHGGQGVRVPITREQIESLTADLLQRTLFTVRSVLRDARLQWADLTRVLLVGGSTRMPAVQQMLERESGLKPDRSVSPDEAVAHGAALYAGMLLARGLGAAPTMTVRNVNSHSLGVLARDKATGRPRNVVLIPRNTPLPAARSRRFRTARPDQRSVSVRVVEGGDASGHNATPVGTCVVSDLPAALPLGTPVIVDFSYAENGRLTIRARLPNLDHEATLSVERSSGLSVSDLNAWKRRLDRADKLLDSDSSIS